MSGSYERMNYYTSFGFSIRWRSQFLAPLSSTSDQIEILDLLTGMGETWSAVKTKFPNANLTALDFSTEMLKKAKLKNETHFDNKVLLLQQDILNSNLPANQYDIVISAFGLKTFDIDQLYLLAAETKRVLKVGGHFSFVEVSKPDNRILNILYGIYLGKIIPILGALLLGNPIDYRMLWRYTSRFANAKKAEEIFKSQGLITKSSSYFYGCSTGFTGYKV